MHKFIIGPCRVLCVIGICLASIPSHAEQGSAARIESSYLARLAARVSSWQDQLQDMDASAERAAEGTIAGGTLYSYGPQHGFATEVVVRAGGLMLARQYSDEVILKDRDTVLAAIVGSEDEADLDSLHRLMDKAGKARAQVVLFGVATLPQSRELSAVTLPRGPVAFAEDHTIASVSNVVGMWAWTGRFVAACTQQGVMPCIYQSHILPDGRLRTKSLEQNDGGRFHVTSDVHSQDAETIAKNYLSAVEHALRTILAKEQDSMQRAASLLRTSRDRGNTVAIYTLGHMFPGELNQPQQPNWLLHVDAIQPDSTVDTAVVLYYMAFPWEIVDKIESANLACIVTCSQTALPAFTTKPENVYIDPHWPIYDAIVELSNYDTRLLPVSGVLDAAVYWQLVEWATADPE